MFYGRNGDFYGATMDLVDASWDDLRLGISIFSPLCTCCVRIDEKVSSVSCTIPLYLNTMPRSTYPSCSMRISKVADIKVLHVFLWTENNHTDENRLVQALSWNMYGKHARVYGCKSTDQKQSNMDTLRHLLLLTYYQAAISPPHVPRPLQLPGQCSGRTPL